MTARIRSVDPRVYQAGVLAGLLIYGGVALAFDITPARAALLLGTALATQLTCSRLWRLHSTDYRSALISGLSLCLLLRTADAAAAAAGWRSAASSSCE